MLAGGQTPSYQGSLSNVMWTNYIRLTTTRQNTTWSNYYFPPDWSRADGGWVARPLPTNNPVFVWNTNSIVYGQTGWTAIGQCNTMQDTIQNGALLLSPWIAKGAHHISWASNGVVTVTIPSGGTYAGQREYFWDATNGVAVATIAAVISRYDEFNGDDYSLMIFSSAVPSSIPPMRVAERKTLTKKLGYDPLGYNNAGSPACVFLENQFNQITSMPTVGHGGFHFAAGDSGEPFFIILPEGIVTFAVLSASVSSWEHVQADCNRLARHMGIPTNQVQLHWADLSRYPDFQ